MIKLQARKLIKMMDEDPNILENVNPKYIYSPIHRKIVEFAKVLHEHGLDIKYNYLREQLNDRAGKQKELYINELKDIHQNDYYMGGDVNAILKKEFHDNVFAEITKTIANGEFEQDQKIQRIDKLICGITEQLDLIEINDVITDIISFIKDPNGEILKRIRISDNRLIQIFGEYIYASPYVIAGRPGDYKTSLLIDLLSHFSRIGLNGVHFTLEDNKKIFGLKFASAFSGIDKDDMFSSNITPAKMEYMQKVRPQGKLFICDKMVDKDDIKRIIKQKAKEMRLDYISLDYVQLVRTGSNKNEGLTEYSYAVMEACKEYEIPFIQTAQLNRVNEGHYPVLGNIKDCGAIEQDARYLYALWKDESLRSSKDTRNLAKLKDSTNGIGDLVIEFDAKQGTVKRVGKYEHKETKRNGHF